MQVWDKVMALRQKVRIWFPGGGFRGSGFGVYTMAQCSLETRAPPTILHDWVAVQELKSNYQNKELPISYTTYS